MSKLSALRPGYRVGILGGGQLARMLVMEGFKMGLEMHVLSKNAADPAAQVTRYWHPGDPDDATILAQFFKKVELVTVESEFMNQTALTAAETASGVKVEPSVKLLGELSDRLSQKQWLAKNKISTAAFTEIKRFADIERFFKLHNSIVLKKRRFGYDGYGTFIIKTKADLDRWQALHANSCHDFIAEAFISFKRELALQFAISARGEVTQFPLVEWQAENSRCLWVKGPVASPKTLSTLATKITSALKKSRYVGVVTFELFEAKNKLLINEMAPRVHNSGHYTLEAMALNQFNAHLRAILNLPLPKKPILLAPAFAMWNLLGTKDQSAANGSWSSPSPSTLQSHLQSHLHWYGKSDIRVGRKMGHLTALGKTSNSALKNLKAQVKGFKI